MGKVLILGFVIIGCLLFLGTIVAKRIVQPIKMLSEGASLLGKGQLDHNITIKTGDEIEELADIFNKMAEDLQRRFHEAYLERDKLNTIMDSIGDGLVILDKNCRILHMNTEFMKQYGEGAIGKPAREVFGIPGDVCKKCPSIELSDTAPHTIEVTTNRGITYLVTHSWIRNMDGSISIVEIFKDITERKRLEQQLLHSERLSALSRFSSTFAHDLRNPIVAIKKTVEMLKGSSTPFPETVRKEIYTDLISTCELLLGLINDVIDIHQVSYKDLPLIFSAFPVEEALKEVMRLLRLEAEEKKIYIEIENRDGNIIIEGDKRRIQRVFINLLSNAIKFSPVCGRITITLWKDGPASTEGMQHFMFKIEDEGPGIPSKTLSKVFDLFYREDIEGIKGGTGLGLYFCRVVVEAHGGTIWVENKKNGGAVFYIKLPLRRGDNHVYQNINSR